MTREELRMEFEDDLHGDCIADFITKKDMMEYIEDFENWLETANNGDTYYYDGYEYTIAEEYEIHLWKNNTARENGEAEYMVPMSSKTDLELIKKEVESYIIEPSGCIEICLTDDEEPVLHYENGIWTEVK